MAASPDRRDEVHVEISPAGVARVLLARPPANAFDLLLYRALAEVVEGLAAVDPSVRCMQLASAVPRYFSGGRDLKEPPAPSPEAVVERQRTVSRLYRRLYDLPFPTIAVVDGFALGTGCVLASLCDIRLASTDAVFGLPEVRAGSVGGARHLMRLLPQGTVRRLALTAEPLSAARVHELGLADLCGSSDDLWREADRLAELVVSLDDATLRRVKAAMNRAEHHSLWEGFDDELAVARGDAGAELAR